jgi:hypothetical protein
LPGDPITPRYIHLDPQFPEWPTPPLATNDYLLPVAPNAAPDVYEDSLKGLRAHYHYFEVGEQVQKVELDLTALAQEGTSNVDVVVYVRNQGWQLRPLTGVSQVTLCDVEKFYLIVSNHDTNLLLEMPADFGVKPLAEGCLCEQVASIETWQAAVTYSYDILGDDGDDRITQSMSGSVTATLTQTANAPTQVNFMAGNLIGAASMDEHHQIYQPNGSLVTLHHIAGSGPPLPYVSVDEGSRLFLVFFLTDCTYRFYLATQVEATQGSSYPVWAGLMQSDRRPIPEGAAPALGGNTLFPAHTPEFIWSSTEPFDWFEQGNMVLSNMLGEENLGAAAVTWNFTPVVTP